MRCGCSTFTEDLSDRKMVILFAPRRAHGTARGRAG
jgi:hypothetical protein